MATTVNQLVELGNLQVGDRVYAIRTIAGADTDGEAIVVNLGGGTSTGLDTAAGDARYRRLVVPIEFANLSSDLQTTITNALNASGVDGTNGWTAIYSVQEDNGRRILRVEDFVGGSGTQPTGIGQFLGTRGLTSSPDEAVDIRGPQGAPGDAGWSPVLSYIADGDRVVAQIIDWVGGDGSKPDIGNYIGVSGEVSDIADGVDVRGARGYQGTIQFQIFRTVANGAARPATPLATEGSYNLATNTETPPANWSAEVPTGFNPTTQDLYQSTGTYNPATDAILGYTDPVEAGAQGPSGQDGRNGWTPRLAVVSDGERRVLQVSDWFGGTGTKPATGQYISASGLTNTLANAIDIRGPGGADGDDGDDGTNGWTPIIVTELRTSDNMNVLRVNDWIGGSGTKPAVNVYLPASGSNYVVAIADAQGLRGGIDGDDGDDGNNGWTPTLSVITSGTRRVLQVSDWVGGTGTKPATGRYVGASGFTTLINSAVDIRGGIGPEGPEGPQGPRADATVSVYRVSTIGTAPARPTGGTYVAGFLVTPPTGWSASVPTYNPATQSIYESRSLGSGNTLSAWGAPFVISGEKGDDGNDGTDGAPGQGVPAGGDADQIMYKIDGTDYNTEWRDAPTGGTPSQNDPEHIRAAWFGGGDPRLDRYSVPAATILTGNPGSVASVQAGVLPSGYSLDPTGFSLKNGAVLRWTNGDIDYSAIKSLVEMNVESAASTQLNFFFGMNGWADGGFENTSSGVNTGIAITFVGDGGVSIYRADTNQALTAAGVWGSRFSRVRAHGSGNLTLGEHRIEIVWFKSRVIIRDNGEDVFDVFLPSVPTLTGDNFGVFAWGGGSASSTSLKIQGISIEDVTSEDIDPHSHEAEEQTVTISGTQYTVSNLFMQAVQQAVTDGDLTLS